MQERRRYCFQLLVLLELFIVSFYVVPISSKSDSGLIEVDVGVILDAHNMVGKVTQTCISMALEDFYALNQNHGTRRRIVLHKRDSKGDIVEAASAGVWNQPTQAWSRPVQTKTTSCPTNSSAAHVPHFGSLGHYPDGKPKWVCAQCHD
ncbi:hypothetical protein RHSIM_Rhsim08G0247700 [Rhododendron simsii]|uniref:Uncharacterized protein n=1 Tax=Rhododendron simsii TaxID=118357 RepID=A0A834GFW9_RHOSS|nr:hypothetical protein RHSIM_Rhsim08G0247700 [Rhododendron simsii]